MKMFQGQIIVVASLVILSNGILRNSQSNQEDFCQTLWADSCQNGGICDTATKDDYECICIGEFTGKNCSVPVMENACTSAPCLHGGLCVLGSDGSFTCDCPREFLGPFCEEKDPCVGSTACKMGSTCVRRTDSEFECQCRTPYTGVHCDEEDLCLIDVGECVDDLIPVAKCFPCAANETCNKISEDTYCCNPECNPSSTTTATTSVALPINETLLEPHIISGYLLPILSEDSGYPVWNMFIPKIVLWTLFGYLVILAIVIRMDRLNSIRPRIIIMGDVCRIAVDTFYLLTVETGNLPFSGTSARIYCIIYGDLGQTKVLVLNNYLMQSMRSNDEIDFLISTPGPLGNILKIQLWLDPNDKSDRKVGPNWYCRNVVVRDIKTEQIWYFFVKKWFSFEIGEFAAAEIRVASVQEVADFYTTRLSWREYWHQTREHHVWLQTFTCPPRSTHTKAERITCSTALFLCYMFFTLLFYGIPEDHHHYISKSFHREVVFNKYYPIWSIGTKVSLAGILVGYTLTLSFRFIRRQLIPALIVWDDARLDRKNIRIQTDSVEFAHEPGGGRTPFRIPSTDMIETEEWINGIQVEPSGMSETEPYQDRFVHKYKGGPRTLNSIQKLRLRGRKRQKESVAAQQLSALTEALADAIPEPIVMMQKQRQRYLRHFRTKLLHRYSRKRIPVNGESGDSNSLGPKPETSQKQIERIGDNMTGGAGKVHILPSIGRTVVVDGLKPWKLELCCVEHSFEHHHCLPHWFVWVLWAFSLSLIMAFSIVIITYGVRFNREKSLNWLASFGWAFTESIFIFQPAKVFIAYIIMLYKRRIRKVRNPEQFDIKLRFKLMWISGEVSPALVIWPLYYLIHPLTFNDEHELDLSRCMFPTDASPHGFAFPTSPPPSGSSVAVIPPHTVEKAVEVAEAPSDSPPPPPPPPDPEIPGNPIESLESFSTFGPPLSSSPGKRRRIWNH